ncbi:DMT(drug/metabolite transporter) superfamily permease [Xenococcus sp. PCC 7305]|uniref:DMT family transporter n=1 Tax=Xenococcus sp. PCC 7305 TaxID=102125 RepID=UPI0002ACB67B|nr:DMT family transporter [Xenococcus sp. PCC 7305]ELS05562.1 DMT(drug/metabolite transporter) superfamily permease [Xenococcus sp. PCC 7305]
MFHQTQKANSTLLGLSLLNLAPLLWGSSYVVLKQTITVIAPSLLTLISYALAALCFTPFLLNNKRLVNAGLELGFWLLLGSATQTIGLQYTSASRSAFITTLYVVLVPLLIRLSISCPKLLAKKNRNRNTYSGAKTNQVQSSIWIAAFLALMGVGILSYDRQTPNIGDLWTLGTACSYALYIIRIENYARKFNALPLAAAQMWGAVGFSLLWVSVDKSHWFTSLQNLWDLPWSSLLYLGLVVTTGTICIQTWGQARIKSTQAAVIYTLEPVWGLVFAYLILGEVLGWRGWFGAGMIVLATLMSHWQSSFFKTQK